MPGIELISRRAHQPLDKEILYYMIACPNKPIPLSFCLVRNPFEWNVSVWRWVRAKNRRWFCGSFSDFIELQRHSVAHDLPDMNTAGLTSIWRFLGAGNCDYVGRFENYENEVVRILGIIAPNIFLERDVRAAVRGVGKVNHIPNDPNGNPRKPWRGYYTSKLRKTVEQMEAPLLERFGYTFD